MATTIKLKNSVTTTSVPSSLVQGEVAINITDKKVWVGNAATTPIQIAGAGTTGNAAGSNTQVQYNSSGSFAGSANFTFNGTTVTMANDASISGLTVGKGTGSVASATVVGNGAMVATNTGADNTAIGYINLRKNTSGANNTGLGSQAFSENTTGSNNTAIGRSAMSENTTGGNNTAVGYGALVFNTTASNNTAVGYQSLYSSTTAPSCTALGYQAGYNITTGQNNICVGFQAGSYGVGLTTGEQNIIIGNYTRTSAVNSQYQFVIGYDVVGQANNNITIGTASGKIYNAFTVNATWTQTSDGRLKKNIQDETLGLSFINRLKPVKYEWKASNELDKDNPYYAEENKRTTGVVMHGLIAQDVKAALDAEGVNTFAGWDVGSDGIQAISREMFVTPLIKAVQELSEQVKTLQAEINQFKGVK